MNKILETKILWIVIYLFLFFLTLVVIQQIWFSGLFEKSNYINWDAEHYNYIRKNGYKSFRVAFFPLFPLLWKLLSVDVYFITIINALIFLISFYVLIKELEVKNIVVLLVYMSIPSFMFFYLPYSESIFFLSSVIIILGLRNNKDYLIYIGLLFSTLSRPAFTIFVPALIITELLCKNDRKRYFRIIFYILISLLGILLVGLIQFYYTGEWFKFFSAQKLWGNQLQIPLFPLTSWGGSLIVRIDGFALLIGLLSGSYIVTLILKLKWVKMIIPPKEVVFSLAYLAGISLSVLLFRGGSLFSLNRFIFATPFIILVFNFWQTQNISLKLKNLFLIFGLIFCFWLLFGSYKHIQCAMQYALLSLYVLLIFTIKSDKIIVKKYSLFLLVIVNFIFQIILYSKFLNGDWVG